jgi:hypothetical protein
MGQMTHLENRSSTAAWSGGRCHGDALGRRVEGVVAKRRGDDRNDQQRRITDPALGRINGARGRREIYPFTTAFDVTEVDAGSSPRGGRQVPSGHAEACHGSNHFGSEVAAGAGMPLWVTQPGRCSYSRRHLELGHP